MQDKELKALEILGALEVGKSIVRMPHSKQHPNKKGSDKTKRRAKSKLQKKSRAKNRIN
jgi:hypothetical protein